MSPPSSTETTTAPLGRLDHHRASSIGSSDSSQYLLSDIQNSKQAPSNIFGISKTHPFANYWTCQGGLPEVLGVLPNKDQADILIAKYFEAVDPVYPMIDKQQFHADYDSFWALPPAEKPEADAALIGLHFVVYAMGTQFIEMSSDKERQQIAEFYASAAHQALRISSYLTRTSLTAVQAMVLICYFLMNDNKASDAWAFGGVLMRQAYAIGLNRDPEGSMPQASARDKQQRRKVWQAVYFQDTFLTVLLKLPPTATFSDNLVEGLLDDPEDTPPCTIGGVVCTYPQSSNPMSICNIAPTTSSTPGPSGALRMDVAFIRSMWLLATIVQPSICTPRALNNPLTTSPRDKANLISSFRNYYTSLPSSFTLSHHTKFAVFAADNPRVARQNLFLRSNYWHAFMLVLADENANAGVRCDVHGAVEAGRVAIGAFFDIWHNFRADAGIWWVFQHRAFEEAVSPCLTPHPSNHVTNSRCSFSLLPYSQHFPRHVALHPPHRHTELHQSLIPSSLTLRKIVGRFLKSWNMWEMALRRCRRLGQRCCARHSKRLHGEVAVC